MKKKSFLFILLFACGICNAQNLVPNPSFENYINCPATVDQFYPCQNWTSYGGLPEYFNSCSPGTDVSVPNNFIGFQYAATGNAYCGYVTASDWASMSREFIGAQLSQPLITGQQYFASLKISYTYFYCPTKKMGIRFSTIPFDSLNPPPINNNAMVYTDSIISDTTNWYQIKGSFIADSNYTYIIVGNFFNTGVGCAMGSYMSYYYVDDVCVSTDSLTCYSSVGIDENNNTEALLPYPNPFTTQLNITLANNQSSIIILYDITSRKLLEQTFFNSVSINTTQLESGIYFYEVLSGNKMVGKGKVVKQ